MVLVLYYVRYPQNHHLYSTSFYNYTKHAMVETGQN